MIAATSCSSASLRKPFTVACVPTGKKNGVSTVPWGVVRRPRRAPDGSVFATSKEKFIKIHLRLDTREPDRQECLSGLSVSGEDEGPTHMDQIEGSSGTADSNSRVYSWLG